MGPKGASLGQVELGSEALDPVGTREVMWPLGKLKEVPALLWSHTRAVPRIWGGCTQSRSCWLFPLLGSGRSGLTLIKSPSSFCKEAGGLGLEGWVMEQGAFILSRLSHRCPGAPKGFLNLEVRTCHISQAMGQEHLSPDSSSLSLGCCWDFLHMPFCHLLS